MNLYNDASLAMIPSAVKDGKLYSIRPTDGSGDFTFSRGSNLAATRVDVNGLIEKGRENLFLQSNQFDTTWTSFVTLTSGQSGYDGSNDAWLLTKTASGAASVYQNITQLGVATMSVYAKAGSTNWMRLTHGGKTAYFDLQNGVVGSTSDGIDQTITSIGNGWFRCTLTANRTIAFLGTPIYPYTAEGDSSGSTDSIYIQDAQIEVGLVATDYIETTTTTAVSGITEDLPRLDYSGSCPSLLLEPQRTNFASYSEYYDAYWNLTNMSFDYNSSVSPEGLNNATKAIPNNGSTLSRIWIGSYGSGSQVVSVFAKAAEYDSLYLAGYDGGAYKYAAYNLSNGTLISATADNYDIEDYGNGWYRIWVYVASSTARYANLSIGNSTDTISSVGFNINSNGTDGLYVYGYQIEVDASYPSSYIPTYGTSQTRSEDICVKTGISSLIGQTEGTLFLDINPLEFASSSRYLSIESSSGAGSGWIGIFASSPDIFRIYGDGFDSNFGGYSVGDRAKIAVAYKNGVSTSIYINGVNKGSITANTTGKDYSILKIGKAIIGDIGAGEFNQVLTFPTPLTDSECIALTTL